jgi:hypothetical protein
MAEVKKDVLQRQWVHSHEEDSAGEMVYRPADYDFPLSRGRTSLDLKPGGALVEQGAPGADDRQQKGDGRWELQGDKLALYSGSTDEPSRVLHIKSADEDRLVIKK